MKWVGNLRSLFLSFSILLITNMFQSYPQPSSGCL